MRWCIILAKQKDGVIIVTSNICMKSSIKNRINLLFLNRLYYINNPLTITSSNLIFAIRKSLLLLFFVLTYSNSTISFTRSEQTCFHSTFKQYVCICTLVVAKQWWQKPEENQLLNQFCFIRPFILVSNLIHYYNIFLTGEISQ